MFCEVCGNVDEHYDENAEVFHTDTPKHLCNLILANYNNNKRSFSKNKEGVVILGKAVSEETNEHKSVTVDYTDHHKIRIDVKPQQNVKFIFSISNETRNDDFLVVGFQLGHPQPQFKMNDHPYVFGEDPHILDKKSSIKEEISISFQAIDIGQYEMPIMFTFLRTRDGKNLIFVREMVVMVQERPMTYKKSKSPYTNEEFKKTTLIKSISHVPYETTYKIPKLLKILLPRGLEDRALEGLQVPREMLEQLRLVLISTRAIFDEGITKDNYMIYFRHLLWWEEIISKINLRKYNMSSVKLQKEHKGYYLQVPGLAEKRPSLLRGDRVFITPKECDYTFESTIKDMDDDRVLLGDFDENFSNYYSETCEFDVRFLMSRTPMERMHEAISGIFTSKQTCRAFPVPIKKKVAVYPIYKFYNKLIRDNPEQRSAVEHIVSGTSGKAPYIVFGPPGTGKTMTIVEAIIQLVVRNSRNRVLVCTDSNMAADHIALMLMRYNKVLNINNFLLRANSRSREWTVMPAELAPVSNGTNYENFFSVSNLQMSTYRVVVTTLSHAAKYASSRSQSSHKLQMSHLFIDEAAQASEPATLIPTAGLLAPAGQLVLAGDPRQLGPVCISHEASKRGLGQSLLERLRTTYENLYTDDSDYITMLVKNFRSDPDILQIPNTLFYEDNLQALAKPDPLSQVSILGQPGGNRAIVFHAVHSREQRMGNAPSYFNERELDMLKRYIKALILTHGVLPEDIGVIAPYIRQVYKMKAWLKEENYEKIEVGTVESFQGKEKRVILVSTVRANCRLLDYDAKYGLGFLVDDKRFNVAITRAKAKIIIIGNPTCLTRDRKWRTYMDLCKEFDCFFGMDTQQIERDSKLLIEIAKTRFEKCRLSEALPKPNEESIKKKKK
ncbi:putative helicase mov-10-B.1 [Ostrinia nubilalis]|uniref:putative helicase mov-10-B.1 n=1 Tax=Ostrinia nubilalis TaxID=29057 RepID=UPI0030823708